MNKVVDSQAAIDAINSHFGFSVEEEYGSAVQEVINSLPPAQLERPKGKWIWKLDEGDPDRSMMLICSRCGGGRNKVGIYNFCNICGAEMINPEPINQW